MIFVSQTRVFLYFNWYLIWLIQYFEFEFEILAQGRVILAPNSSQESQIFSLFCSGILSHWWCHLPLACVHPLLFPASSKNPLSWIIIFPTIFAKHDFNLINGKTDYRLEVFELPFNIVLELQHLQIHTTAATTAATSANAVVNWLTSEKILRRNCRMQKKCYGTE